MLSAPGSSSVFTPAILLIDENRNDSGQNEGEVLILSCSYVNIQFAVFVSKGWI